MSDNKGNWNVYYKSNKTLFFPLFDAISQTKEVNNCNNQLIIFL